MALFKTTAELKAYLPMISSSFKFEDIKPSIEIIEIDVIKKILGSAFYTTYHANFQANTPATGEAALLPYIQRALAHISLAILIPQVNVMFTNGGIVTAQTSGAVSASMYKIEELKDSCNYIGHKALEQLIDYLVANKSTFPSYESGEGYSEASECFINSATEFSQYYNIQNNRWIFWNIKTIMKRLEEDRIKKSLGTTLYDTIKAEIKSGSVSAANKKLFPFIKAAMANLTIAEAIIEMGLVMDKSTLTIYTSGTTNSQAINLRNPAPRVNMDLARERCDKNGEAKMTELDEFLYANKDDYPGYSTEVYVEDMQTDITNTEGSGSYKV